MRSSVPEKPPLLEITPDLARRQLIVSLAQAPENDCALVWEFPTALTGSEDPRERSGIGSVSAHKVLKARGSGNWDAIYSGSPGDREPKIGWSGDDTQANERWMNYWDYAEEWWQQVLSQLVWATGGLNITQLD